MTTTDDTYGIPDELLRVVQPLYKGTYTLRELIHACDVGAKLGKQHQDKRRYIANCLEGLCRDYSFNTKDDDLYQIRYTRLMPEIEEELGILRQPDEEVEKTGKSVDQHWVTLTWLVEDQEKIIS